MKRNWPGPVLLAVVALASSWMSSETRAAQSQPSCKPDIELDSSRTGDEVQVHVKMRVQVPVAVAWEVMTDYDHASGFIHNLRSSRSEVTGNQRKKVTQIGWTGVGGFGMTIKTVYGVMLDLDRWQVSGDLLSGDLKSMKMQARLNPAGAEQTTLDYRVTTDPGPWVPGFLAEQVMRNQASESFADLATEMVRRAPACMSQPSRATETAP